MQAAFWVTHQSPLKLELLEVRTRSCSWVSTLTFSVYLSEVCIEYTGCALRQQSLPAASVKRTPGKQCFSIMSDVLCSHFHHFSMRTLKSSLRRKVFLEEVVLHVSSLKSLTPQNGSLSSSVTTPTKGILLAKWRPNSIAWGFSQLHNALKWLDNAWCW